VEADRVDYLPAIFFSVDFNAWWGTRVPRMAPGYSVGARAMRPSPANLLPQGCGRGVV
jgi:hypothetical protein